MYSYRGMAPLYKPEESLKAYGDNPWLGGAVDKIAREIARTKFHLQIENNKGEIEVIRNHEALDTLKKPQPTKTGKSLLSGMQLQLVTGYHLCLAGEAFWLLDKRRTINGAPKLIDILQPQYVHQRIENGELIEYVYRLPDREIHLRGEDVVHFKIPDPEKPQRGHAPTKSIRYALDTHQEADKLNLKKIQNGAVPGGTIESDQAVPESERRKILSEWKAVHAGASNVGKTAMLPWGLGFKKTEESNADMQYTQGKETNRMEILARYGVGPEILGMTDSQTRANAEAAIFVFMKFGASFFIELVADTLTNDYLSAFPGTEGMTFSFPDPVPENMEEKRLNAQTLFNIGAATPNELRKDFGMEALDLEGMDSPYIDFGKSPIGESPPSLAA